MINQSATANTVGQTLHVRFWRKVDIGGSGRLTFYQSQAARRLQSTRVGLAESIIRGISWYSYCRPTCTGAETMPVDVGSGFRCKNCGKHINVFVQALPVLPDPIKLTCPFCDHVDK